MILNARKGFKRIIWFLDLINPFVVIISITGLILEYTFLREYVFSFNGIVDVMFLADFTIRMIAFPSKKYFLESYGWVDLLAAIPGLDILLRQAFPSVLKIFKVLRVGRFFKIIRILRFLRVFSFLKKMKSDSPYIQDRLMKIGITVVLISVVGIGFIDVLVDKMYKNRVINNIVAIDVADISIKTLPKEVVTYRFGNKYFGWKDAKFVSVNKKFFALKKDLDQVVVVDINEKLSVIIFDKLYNSDKNSIMMGAMLTLIFIIVGIIFVIGYFLARDIKLVNLIVDSIDADEYMLLLNEGKSYKNKNGYFYIEEGEEEIISLFKMVNKLIEDNHIGYSSGVDTESEFQMTDVMNFSGDKSMEFNEDVAMNLDDAQNMINDMGDGDIDLSDDSDLSLDDDLTLDEESSEVELSNNIDLNNVIDDSQLKKIIAKENESFKRSLLGDLTKNVKKDSEEVALKAVKIAAKSIIKYIKDNR